MKHLVILFSFILSLTAAAEVKVGRVDIQKAMLTVKEGKSVSDKLKGEFNKKQALIKKEEEAIKKQQASFEKKSAVMSADAKVKKQREIQQKIMQLQQKTMEYQQEIQKKEQEMKLPILEKIKKAIDSVSDKGGYDLVFEAQMSPVFAKKAEDITDKVIKAYDSMK